jgi:hypothetical protein
MVPPEGRPIEIMLYAADVARSPFVIVTEIADPAANP